MDDPADPNVTRLLAGMSETDRSDGLADGLPEIYEELRRLAGSLMANERASHTLQPTALVHEAYLRLAGRGHAYADRGRFVRTAARVMRHILIDHARIRNAEKRGGGRQPSPLTEAVSLDDFGVEPEELLALDDALGRLGALDERKARVVELRFFAGSTIDETAEALGISTATAEREWRFARAWLRGHIETS